MARMLGVDYGERRIGLAVSDPTGTIASPLGTVSRRLGKRPPWAELERVVREHEIGGIVLGLPLDLNGAETSWSAEVREFASRLSSRTGIDVYFIDERLTSVLAERVVRWSGLRRSEREEKERIDETAAAIILQIYLEQQRNRHG